MHRIKSIGNISDMVVSKNADGNQPKKPTKKLSEMLREERQMLFENKKPKIRILNNILPRSRRRGKTTSQSIGDEEIYRSANLIIGKIRKGGRAEHIKDINDLRNEQDKYWLLFVCYILYQCFDIHARNVSRAFGLWRDIAAQTNRRFKIEFAKDKDKEVFFLNIFDYFMEYNDMEYL